MLKMLRYDFYKIFKSKALFGVFVASVCLSFLDSIFIGLAYGDTSVLQSSNASMVVQYLPLIFVVPFACKDSSSKFTKNLFPEYSRKDRICYVLSKVMYIFAVNLIWHAVFFLSHCAFVYLQCQIQHAPFVFESISYDGTVFISVSEGMFCYFCVFVNAFAIGMFILFLSILMQKEYFVLVVVVLHWFALAWPIYDMLNKVMGLTKTFHTVEWFTVFGMQSRLRSNPYIPNGTKIMMAGYTKSFFISLGYSVLFAFLSCVVVAAKRPSKMRQTVKEGGAVC